MSLERWILLPVLLTGCTRMYYAFISKEASSGKTYETLAEVGPQKPHINVQDDVNS